jgi:hypothetical protein
MRRPSVTRSPVSLSSFPNGEAGVPVGVTLLGVRVTAQAVINVAEHQRRAEAGLGAVINPALLNRLLDLPLAMPVSDPMLWAEMADQPTEILERREGDTSLTRRLDSPLTITDVVVNATAGKELRAVQDASLFAGFTRRWVAATRSRITDAAILEAKLCGVGVLGHSRSVLLRAEKPVDLTLDGWSWLLQEETYRRWLT